MISHLRFVLLYINDFFCFKERNLHITIDLKCQKYLTDVFKVAISYSLDSYGRYMFMGLAIAGPFILMLIAVGIFIFCRRCSK